MNVIVAGERVTLDDKLLLGQGGEARVYAHPNPALGMALKVYHPADARLHALRLEKLARFPCSLPLVVAPRALLHDDGGAVVGYAMDLVKGAVDIAQLASKRTRAALANNDAILALFRTLADALAQMHARGVVVGDLNDGNVILDDARAPRFIDADSMQIGALPCPMAHERFLDPRLYGRDLVACASFDPASDAYALRVLLFQSLLCVHPYGGVHPKLPTLLRRAEAAHSILRGDVVIPRAAIPFDTLSDDLLDDLTRCFDRTERRPIPPALFATRFRTCACGVEHARASCPACKTAVQAPSVRTQGGVTEEAIVETRGLVLLARSNGCQLAYLIEEDGRVRREDHATVLASARAHGMRFEIAGDATWVGLGSSLVKVRGEEPVDRARTAGGFAAGRAGLFVVEGDALVHHESRVRVGRVLEGQTALYASDAGGLGVYRAGRKLHAFLFTPSTFVDADLPQPRGKLVDLDVTFDDDGRALVGFACDDAGRRVHTLALVDARGRLLACAEGAPDSTPVLQSIRGKCCAGGRMLSTSNEGVCTVEVDGRALRTGSVFVDTRPFVDATVELLPGVGGSLVVVSPRAITRLRLNGARRRST